MYNTDIHHLSKVTVTAEAVVQSFGDGTAVQILPNEDKLLPSVLVRLLIVLQHL